MQKVLLTLAVGWLLAGCGDSTGTGASGGSGGGGGAGGAATGGEGPQGGFPPIGDTVTYSGHMNELTASGLAPITDVQICAESHPQVECVTAGEEGAYTWPGVPANTEVLIRATKPDFVDSTTFLASGDMDVEGFDGVIASRGTETLLYALINVTPDATKASVGVTIVTPELDDMGMPTGALVGLAGASATMTPNSGTGPVYANDSNVPNPDLTETGAGGLVLWANADPGEVEIDVTAPGLICARGLYGWPAQNGGLARGTTSADTVSFFQIVCE